MPSWIAPSPSPTTTEHCSKKLASSSPVTQRRRPPVPQTQWDNPNDPFENTLSASLPQGVSLSLIDEGSASTTSNLPLSISTTSISLPSMASSTEKKSSTSGPPVTSPPESTDHLYEYFPLSLDDWIPPVDAIYRPHVVHHLCVPAEVKAQQLKGRSKRYFSAED